MTANKTIKAVIFDMGGVLLRTEDPAPRTALAEKFGLTRRQLEALVFQSENAIASEKGLVSESAHWLSVAGEVGLDPAGLPEFIEAFWEGDRLDLNLVEFIKSLRPAVKTGLLSNAWGAARESVGGRYVFFDAFDQVVFSSEVGLRKPDKAIFELILSRLNVSAQEAVFVDDFFANIEGAQSVGLKTVHFKDINQAIAEIQLLM
jgi:glucose-1-phosphatase